MEVVERALEAYAKVDHWRRDGARIGLIPTMGALHEGHYSLVKRSVEECDVTLASIFVNPTQFGPHEDFGKYPRTLDSDLQGLQDLGCDLVFVPQPEELYPEGFSTYIDPPALSESLEGVCRPGHFRGVVTVVAKLFNIMPATIAYFGQKDYQQLAVIRRMTEDLNLPIRIQSCDTVREADGLAKSSRNRYLSEEQRRAALSLWHALSAVQTQITSGIAEVKTLEKTMETALYKTGAERIDYARIVHADSLAQLEQVAAPAVALIAAYVGKTRLIDNLVLDVPKPI